MQAATGKTPEQLLIHWPEEGRGVWEIFLALNQTRNVGMAASGIAFTEIEAYTRLHGVRLTCWELQVIQMFDRLALEASS